MVWWEGEDVDCNFSTNTRNYGKSITSAENGGGTTGITTTSLLHKKLDPVPKTPNKDKKDHKKSEEDLFKKGGDNNEGGGNGKKNKDTTPKRIVVVKQNEIKMQIPPLPLLLLQLQDRELGCVRKEMMTMSWPTKLGVRMS